MMDQKEENSARKVRRRSFRQDLGRLSTEERNKFIIISIMGAVLVLVVLSLLVAPRSRGRPPKKTKNAATSFEEKRDYAREKLDEAKVIMRKAAKADSSKTKNTLLKEAEEVLWKAREAYSDILDSHEGEGYEYLETEVAEVQKFIFHCQKTRTLE